jgi:DeoR/GlpR family transcriptional regulator of sugar metabolism
MRAVRLETLRDLVEARGAVNVEEAAEELNVSKETIRRDMGELAARGLVNRTRGGAAAFGSSLTERDLDQRRLRNGAEKTAIARYIAEHLVQDGMSVGLDGGTTTLELARQLAGRDVTVVTSSIPVVMELAHTKTNVTVLGGELRSRSMTVGGPFATDMMGQFHTDVSVVSGPAIGPREGLMDSYADGVALKRAMIQNSDSAYAALDSSKIGRRSFVTVCALADLDAIITDATVSAEDLASFEESNIKIYIAGSNSVGQSKETQ